MRYENEEQRRYSFTGCCESIERLISKGRISRGMLEVYSSAIGIISMHQHYDPNRAERILAIVRGVCTGESVNLEENSLLTETATAVGKVIGMLQYSPETNIFRLLINQFNNQFNVKDLTPEEFRELKYACVNHLTPLIPGIEKEEIE